MGTTLLRGELREIAEPVLKKVVDHPFWSGLRDGSLPGEALVHFVQQDTGYLLPACGRAFARCAAITTDDSHATLLAHCAFATVEAAPRLRQALVELAPRFGIAPPVGQAPIDPTTHAYCSFFHAATTESLVAGLGSLLPMMWFHLDVCEVLHDRCLPGSRYAPWVEVYDPGEGAWRAVRAFLDMVDQIGERCSADERARLVEHFSIGIRYEWAFANGGWRRPTWPV